ncbi:MAG: 3-hydroxyacyl-CoA dehydrogenase NAD-binding domain-containing protein [Maricaulis sp.]|uniref:3-hydroxyacyl-CoA dehydrogenase NAD-binding domain-containing protein n=1 Tax=Maricaulis sp. TaxID=1486257 RepID=UPI002611C097|nr:3-hydroxyacyl-CoA dehydrogenase NAD-binding domain-containing protein [Maricaulis sp.]MDM7982930.1 3-hydroxyacyl-CoA dehydrogenase NAD-binding domain-containing protein [Maricaulis sp.]
MSPVSTQLTGTVLVITIDHPPVNALSHAVRAGIVRALEAAPANTSAAVLQCAGRTFFSGADISEFGKPPQAPTLSEAIEALENAPFPVVAAIHGQALGGGLEIALGCDFRVMDAKARVGLPEVTLGLIPGAGGTQRLPRIAGMALALEMASQGKPISAAKALETGIADAIAESDLVASALAFAKSKSRNDKRSTGARPNPETDASAVDYWRAHAAKRQRGQKAPLAAIDAVEASATLDIASGLKRERELFLERMSDTQSAAMRHLFFAERKSAKLPGPRTDPLPLERAAVIGSGTMGVGIAASLLSAGLSVKLLDMSDQALQAGYNRIKTIFQNDVTKGRLSEAGCSEILGRLAATTQYSDLSDSDIVIEAVFEDIEIKHKVFAQLANVVGEQTVLATNTSYLDVDAIAERVANPERVLGLHFFSPAHIMRLLEVVRGKKTSAMVLASAMQLGKRMRKVAAVSGVCHGFIGNRMLSCYGREAGLMLLEGASPRQIDKALTDFGMPMGPFTMGDMAGLDIGYMNRQKLDPESFEQRAFLVHDRLVEMDRKGQKTGSGFYRYEKGDRTPLDDEAFDDVLRAVRSEQGISLREFDDSDIVDRCMLGLINEGAKILDEGIAWRGSDIDVVYANGYGFPRYRGGPMFYADTIGLDAVLAGIRANAERFGDRWWTPSNLLLRLAESGERLSAYETQSGALS